jgi:hypothetical protein
MGQQLGILGKYGERHLHLEVHSFGPSTTGFYNSQIRNSGIIPIIPGGVIASLNVPPYLYDAVQISPSIPQLTSNLFNQIKTNNLLIQNNINYNLLNLQIQINGQIESCSLKYETIIMGNAILQTLNEYRTTYEFGNYLSTYSIDVATTPPPP